MVCANVSLKRAREVMTREAEGCPAGSLLGAPLRAAYLEIREAAERKEAIPPAASPAGRNIFAAANILSDSRDEFISRHLSNGTRAMTPQEIAKASKDQRREAFTGVPSAAIPMNLEKFWTHHQNQTSSSPRGNQPHADYQRRIAKQSYDALHQEACAAASLLHQNSTNAAQQSSNTSLLPAPAPTLTSIMRQERYFADTPASAHHPAVLASLQQPTVPASAQAILSHVLPQQQSAPTSKPPFSTRQPTASHPIPHPSPQVRLAQEREKPRLPAAGEQSTNNLNITVDTGLLPSNCVIWKAGKEADGAGFNYHAYSGVKTSWEQVNADKTKAYRTIKSFIDPRFIGTICDYITVDRTYYDKMPDSELFRLLEEKLRPTDSTIYFMKVNSLKISLNPADGTLSARYSAFAEAFLATVNEAKEAGTPLRNEAVRHAFRTVCNSNGLLRMWLGAEEWSTVQAAHQRIYLALQKHENHQLCATLGGAPTSTVATPAAQAPLAQAPPTQYTPEQKREYALAKQQRHFASQQQQQLQQQHLHQQQLHHQQVLANSVQQQVDLAVTARMNQAQAAMPPQAPVLENNTFQLPRQNPQQFAQHAPLAPHPGLDSRGPIWHVHSPALACRTNPCSSLSFCQGCGTHGHFSADCRRRMHPGWNASGYYSDRYPGNGALPYATPKPPAQQYQFQQLPAPAQQLQAHPQQQQLRIASPPVSTPLVHANPFPTPFKVNNVTRTPVAANMQPPPSVQVNASTQLSSSPPDQSGADTRSAQ